MTYLILKYLHVIGAVVLLGTGGGIAFFMLMAHRTGDAAFIANTARIVVIADFLFTATAVAVQPVTGFLLMQEVGLTFSEFWLAASVILYIVAGLFWLPVVWMQIRMRDLAAQAAAEGGPLPDSYHVLYRRWFLFGFPGFGAVMATIWLMLAMPVT
ncbi:MAG TPA: DUF2269 domain-containing protein [Rhodospirillaceae bacterium]|nr:DUF2269 domain-containing protein [Rhodospirillaceae bacterium]